MTRALPLCLCLLASPGIAEEATDLPHEHQIDDGDTWASLASHYWGDTKLADALAGFAALDTARTLPIGETLRIPDLAEHEVLPGETLLGISRAYYGTPARAPALARLNGIRDPDRLGAGRRIRVPVFGGAAAPTPPARAPEAPGLAEAPGTAAAAGRYAPELRRAVNAYLDGGFEAALGRLEKLRTPVLAGGSIDEQRILLRSLVFVYVAFERGSDACDAYRGLRRVDPETRWDPDLVSPKILGVVAACEQS